MKFLSVIITSFISLSLTAQVKMRPLEDLINNADPGWPLVRQWIDSAKNKIEILAVDTTKAKDALYKTQVTTRSPMGAIVFSTGGILVDFGWLRILGSGSEKLNRSLPYWNKGKSIKEFGDMPGFWLVADDAVGGFFAINGGKLGKDAGKVYYLSPVSIEWEGLDITYTEFLNFCFNGDLKNFYKDLRWNNWVLETSKLAGDKVFAFYPFLWSKEGKDVNKNVRSVVPVEEQYTLIQTTRITLGLD